MIAPGLTHPILYEYACGQCTAGLYLPRNTLPSIFITHLYNITTPYMAGLLVTHYVRTPDATVQLS